jgi:hypothetical protein
VFWGHLGGDALGQGLCEEGRQAAAVEELHGDPQLVAHHPRAAVRAQLRALCPRQHLWGGGGEEGGEEGGGLTMCYMYGQSMLLRIVYILRHVLAYACASA